MASPLAVGPIKLHAGCALDAAYCTTPPSGGACLGCNYPRAYAHPDNLLEAFRVDALYIQGTAMMVYSDYGVEPGFVQIIQRDGSQCLCVIPCPEGTIDAAIMDNKLTNTSPAQFERDAVSPLTALGPVAAAVIRPLLRELDRKLRIQELERAPPNLLLVDDHRPRVTCSSVGPFPGPVSQIRLALLPGEADHVRIYDLRVCTQDNYPIGVSVLDRIPGYGPTTVQEKGPPVDLGSHVTCRYLPGSVIVGRLRDGARPWDPDDPYKLQPDDLLDGVLVELPTPLLPLCYVYLIYSVASDHALVAVIKPE